MHRIDSPGATPEGQFKTSPLPATRVDADWLNAVQEEIITAIAQLGGALPDKENQHQLAAAIIAYVAHAKGNVERVITDPAGGNSGLDGGASNQLLVAILAMITRGLNQAITITVDPTTSERTISFLGGLAILKLGYFRETVTSEVVRNVAFALPFPNSCWSVLTQGVIAAPSIYRDLWVQIVPGSTTKNGFQAQFQSDDDNDHALSGFDWWALGN